MNDFDHIGMKYIVDALKKNASVTILEICSFHSFSGKMMKLTQFTASNKIGTEGAKILCEELKTNKILEQVDIGVFFSSFTPIFLVFKSNPKATIQLNLREQIAFLMFWKQIRHWKSWFGVCVCFFVIIEIHFKPWAILWVDAIFDEESSNKLRDTFNSNTSLTLLYIGLYSFSLMMNWTQY